MTNAEMAIKMLNKELLAESKSVQYKDEAATMLKCKHQNVISLTELFETQEQICIVTEF